jgi:hypothetical protein
MNYKQLELKYKKINSYKLRNVEDLKNIHLVDFENIDGFYTLTNADLQLYKQFLINFYNGWGLERRCQLVPVSISRVEEIDYLIFDQEEDCYINTKTEIYNIDSEGRKTLKEVCNYNVSDLEIIPKVKNYLRFDYKDGNSNDWLHVINDNEWY